MARAVGGNYLGVLTNIFSSMRSLDRATYMRAPQVDMHVLKIGGMECRM